MHTQFKFIDTLYREVIATPEGVNLNGKSGNMWTFYGYNELSDLSHVHLCKTFMVDRTTKSQIIEQFKLMT